MGSLDFAGLISTLHKDEILRCLPMRTKNACRDIIVTAPVQINIRIHVNIYINITHIFGVFSKPKRRETSLKETEASGAVLINLKPQERKKGWKSGRNNEKTII